MGTGDRRRLAEALIVMIGRDKELLAERLLALRREPDHPVFGIIKRILRAGIRGGREETDHGIV